MEDLTGYFGDDQSPVMSRSLLRLYSNSPVSGWTEPGGPGSGSEKIAQTWSGLDLGQSTPVTKSSFQRNKDLEGGFRGGKMG